MIKPLIRIIIGISLFLSCASCTDSGKNIPKTGRLEQAIQVVRNRCDIPMEWPPTWPVPTGEKNGREFRILFYPLVPGDGLEKITIYAPRGAATFDMNDGTVSDCGLVKNKLKALSSKRWPDAVSGISVKELQRLQTELYEATEEVAVLYTAGKEFTQETRKRIRDYAALFDTMAEPALRSYYYEVNPDFWEWMRRNGAGTLKK